MATRYYTMQRAWYKEDNNPNVRYFHDCDNYVDLPSSANVGEKCYCAESNKTYSWSGSAWAEVGATGPQGPSGGTMTMTTIVNTLYPVGAVYVSTLSTNPGTLFGVGTWAAFGAGKALVGYASGDPDFGTVEGTGGTKTHTLQTTEIPSHSHVQQLPSGQTGNFASGTRDTSSGGTGGSPATVADTVSTQTTGGGGAHNNLQPYIVVYLFKRTA